MEWIEKKDAFNIRVRATFKLSPVGSNISIGAVLYTYAQLQWQAQSCYFSNSSNVDDNNNNNNNTASGGYMQMHGIS